MIVVYILLILIGLYFLISFIMFIFLCRRYKNNTIPIIDKKINDALIPYNEILQSGLSWLKVIKKSGLLKDVYIKSNDGLRLHGMLISHKKPKGIIIEVHGYRSTIERDLIASVSEYYNMGYSILLIDQRACGKSEGRFLTFGIKESEDIICWCKYINKRYDLDIILAGISMGATSVLMSMKDIDDSMNVKSILVDSPYVNAYDEVLYCIKHYFHINGNLFIGIINGYCKLFAKFDLNEKDVIACVYDKDIPLLLVHGSKDDFVPCVNSKVIYNCYKGKKELLVVKGANHGMSFLINKDDYLKIINKVLKSISK